MRDIVIIGAGIYGLYSALKINELEKDAHIIVLEMEDSSFTRATYINQARVHMGYHYPRSYSTAIKSAHYFNRFNEAYDYCVNSSFDQVYATSTNFSWTNRNEFIAFCKAADIKCEELVVDKYFKKGQCDGAYLTQEYTYDAKILMKHMLDDISKFSNIEIRYNSKISNIEKLEQVYKIYMEDGSSVESDFVVNVTYAGVNTILDMLNYPKFKIKYELCEIILCEINDKLRNTGITVMDGPFFSIMPFGKTGYHSLTSVTFTPHFVSYDDLPTFECQKRCEKGYCSPKRLGNCNNCIAKPQSAWDFMSTLARKYLKDEYEFKYVKSLFSMKPILMASEIDDSRPTVIKVFSQKPTFISCLSGKINTVFDLDEVFKDELK